MGIDWSQFEKTGEYNKWKPENVGDEITGVITAVRIATMPDGNRFPSLSIRVDDDVFEVLVSQQQLLRLVAAENVDVGDTIAIVHTSVEKLSGSKTLKHFTVEVTKGTPLSADDVI